MSFWHQNAAFLEVTYQFLADLVLVAMAKLVEYFKDQFEKYTKEKIYFQLNVLNYRLNVAALVF